LKKGCASDQVNGSVGKIGTYAEKTKWNARRRLRILTPVYTYKILNLYIKIWSDIWVRMSKVIQFLLPIAKIMSDRIQSTCQ
jgi:hypothetical protein